jgi:hypothetical protein
MPNGIPETTDNLFIVNLFGILRQRMAIKIKSCILLIYKNIYTIPGERYGK